MKRGMHRLRAALPTAVLAGLLLLTVGCSKDLPAAAPQANPPVAKTSTTPTDDVQTPGIDQNASSDPFCAKLELDKAAFEKMDNSSSEQDTPEQVQAASKAVEQIAAEAPDEIKPALEQVAKLLPKVDTDNPDVTAAAQFATAMQTLVGWSVQHCGRDLFS